MRRLDLTFLGPRERCTAVLAISFSGYAPDSYREARWLFGQLRCAADQSIALNAVLREVAAQFPRCDPDEVVERLVNYPLSDTYVAWTREDGVGVFVGSEPQDLILPIGQRTWAPGFNMTDWMYNVRPRPLVHA